MISFSFFFFYDSFSPPLHILSTSISTLKLTFSQERKDFCRSGCVKTAANFDLLLPLKKKLKKDEFSYWNHTQCWEKWGNDFLFFFFWWWWFSFKIPSWPFASHKMRTETSSETYLPARLQWNVDEPENGRRSGAARVTMNPVFQSWLRGFGIRVKQNAQRKEKIKMVQKAITFLSGRRTPMFCATGPRKKVSSSSIHPRGLETRTSSPVSPWHTEGVGKKNRISRQRMWKSTCGGSVFSVECPVGLEGTYVHPSSLHPTSPPSISLQSLHLPPQVQQGLSMTSVTSTPYTSSRSTRKERSPWGSSPMALTWSAVRVGSTLPATSDSVWKMRLFSSMKNLRRGTHGQRRRHFRAVRFFLQ